MNLLPALLLSVMAVSPHQAHLNATLARASAFGDTRKAALQLREGADVNSLTILGQRPLELAVEYRHLETARLLLDHGALVNGASGFGTPLSWAALNGDAALTHLLLDRGAWPDYGGQGSSPLTAAIFLVPTLEMGYVMSRGFVEILPKTPHNFRLGRLVEAKLEEQDAARRASLSPEAVKQRRSTSLQILRLLLKYGASVNRKGNAGSTALMTAAMCEDVDAAKLFLVHGAIVDAQDQFGETALCKASGASTPSGETGLVKLLLEHNASPNTQSKSGITALSQAVEGQNLEIIKLLLTHGANPNLTPLMYSINPKSPPQPGETILARAKEYGNTEIIALLENAGAK